ncbi:MAG: RNA polymerase sigma factor [Oscillospiraceae bacterium]
MIIVTPECVSCLFDSYADMVYRIAFNIVRSREEAEDIVMDTFTALIRQESFEDPGHAKAWLIRTAQNKSLNVVKSGRVNRNVPLDELLENVLSSPASNSEYELFDLVMRLPDKLKTTVYMYYYEDMTAAQIAGALGISENTVYKRLERGRSALKISLEEDAI